MHATMHVILYSCKSTAMQRGVLQICWLHSPRTRTLLRAKEKQTGLLSHCALSVQSDSGGKPFFCRGGVNHYRGKNWLLGINLSVNAKRILLSPLTCGKHQLHLACSSSQIHSNVELEIFPNGQIKTRMDI